MKWDITEFPTCECIRQRIIDFSYEYSGKKNLVHDNAAQFTTINFSQYDIHAQNTAPASLNMNAYTERVIGTIRREALDHFLLFSEKQIRNIITNYVGYYNKYRPHQGINRIPDGESTNTTGVIKNESILGGIHHPYFGSSA